MLRVIFLAPALPVQGSRAYFHAHKLPLLLLVLKRQSLLSLRHMGLRSALGLGAHLLIKSMDEHFFCPVPASGPCQGSSGLRCFGRIIVLSLLLLKLSKNSGLPIKSSPHTSPLPTHQPLPASIRINLFQPLQAPWVFPIAVFCACTTSTELTWGPRITMCLFPCLVCCL